MSTQTAETTAFNPATDNSSDPAGTLLPPTASHASKSLSLFISGKPLLSDKTLAIYTRVIREGMADQSYTLADWNDALGLDAENPLGDVVLRTLENRVSDNDAVLESSKTLETQLKEKFGAEGRGLHEYTSNVEDELPDNLVKTLRWIATRRNGIVHGDGDGFQDTQERARYVLQAARSWDWLKNANYESPENNEQRIAASSLRKTGMSTDMSIEDATVLKMVGFGGIFGVVFGAGAHSVVFGVLVGGLAAGLAFLEGRSKLKKEENKSKIKGIRLR